MSRALGATTPKEVGHMRIPVLPTGLARLLRAINDESLGYREIGDVIGQSPSIALRVLGLANSAWSAPVEPISSLDVACGRLGLEVIRSVAMALTIAEVFNPAACPAFESRRYWVAALLTADASALLAEEIPDLNASQARMAGLIRTIGLLWLADSQPVATQQALDARKDEPEADLDRLLIARCGTGYLKAGRQLAEHWNLPLDICEAAFAACPPMPVPGSSLDMPAVVCRAARISHDLRAGESGDDRILPEDPGTRKLCEDVEKRISRLEQLAEQICR